MGSSGASPRLGELLRLHPGCTRRAPTFGRSQRRRSRVPRASHMRPRKTSTSGALSSTFAKFFVVVSLVAAATFLLNSAHSGLVLFESGRPIEGKMVHVTFTTTVESDIKTAFTYLSDWRYIQQWDPNVPKSKKVRTYWRSLWTGQHHPKREKCIFVERTPFCSRLSLTECLPFAPHTVRLRRVPLVLAQSLTSCRCSRCGKCDL